MGIVVKCEELEQMAKALHQQGQKVVTTNGCFDLLHIGHVRILNAAKQLGDVLVVGINSDASVRKLKGDSRPLTPEAERAEILANLACVDYVTIFTEDKPLEFLKAVKPAIHVKGSDYKASDLAETPLVESFGGKLVLIDLVPNHSTSSIVSKMKQAKC